MHAAASGKVMLAFMSDSKRNKILKSLKFNRFTDNTITNKAELEAELEKVRECGFAVDNKEYDPLLTCISAPLYYRRKVVAAVTLSGILLEEERIDEVAHIVRDTSAQLADALSKSRC